MSTSKPSNGCWKNKLELSNDANVDVKAHLKSSPGKNSLCKSNKACVSDAESSTDCEGPCLPVLSDKQRQVLRSSWLVLKNEIYHVGVVTFINLFESKMEYKRSFTKFSNMSTEELRNSPLVRMHAMSVLHVIEQLLDRLDCITMWHAVIGDLARRHAGLNVKPDVSKDVALQCWLSMEPVLKDSGKYDEDTKEAWLAVLNWLGLAMEWSLRKSLRNGAITSKF